MYFILYLVSAIAIISTVMVITRLNAVHGLLYLIVSLLAVAVIFYILGAPFVAALEVIIYAGAIMVLFVFVIMMLNLGAHTAQDEHRWYKWRMFIGPGFLALILLGETIYAMRYTGGIRTNLISISPQQVGMELYGTYLLGVELSSILLLAGLVAAYHLGRRHYHAQPRERV